VILDFLTPEKIKFFRENPSKASEVLLNVKLEWFQRAILNMAWNKPFSLTIDSRGIGKTWVGADWLLLHAILYNRVKAGVYAKDYGYTKETFEKIIEMYETSAFLRQVTKVKPDIKKEESYIELYNNSFIIAEPVKRSKRRNIVMIDEAREMDMGIYDNIVYPFLNAKHPVLQNKSFMVSSATYENTELHKLVKKYMKFIDEGDPNYGLIMFDVNAALTGPWLDKVILSNARKRMMDQDYRIEYLNEFVSLAEGWINSYLIHSSEISFKPELKGDGKSVYFIACDPAIVSGGDNSAIVVCKVTPENGVQIVRSIALNGVLIEDQSLLIRRLIRDYIYVERLILDNEKTGIFIRQSLAREVTDPINGIMLPPILCKDEYDKTGLHLIEPINFADKNLIYSMALKARKGMQDNQIHFPKDHLKIFISDEEKKSLKKEDLNEIEMSQEISELKKEVASIKCKISDTGTNVQFVSGTGGKRDRFTAFFLCSSFALDYYLGMLEGNDDSFVGCIG
jgi:hypothetical protein